MNQLAMRNPLLTLGLSPDLVMHEAKANNLPRIMAMAKGSYKLLSRLYHPDQDDGDKEIMASLTQAFSELDDLETLAFYVEDLLGEVDSDKEERRQIIRDREERQRRAYQSTVQLLWHSNQFEMLGVNAPTSFLVDFMDERIVIDVLAPDKTMLSLADSGGAGEIPGLYARYRDGVWSESLTYEDLPDRRVQYAHLRSQGDVRIIGGVTPALGEGLESGPLISSGGFLEGHVPQGVVWSQVSEAWFMPQLGSFNVGDHLVMMKNGLVAITGMVLASAPLQ